MYYSERKSEGEGSKTSEARAILSFWKRLSAELLRLYSDSLVEVFTGREVIVRSDGLDLQYQLGVGSRTDWGSNTPLEESLANIFFCSKPATVGMLRILTMSDGIKPDLTYNREIISLLRSTIPDLTDEQLIALSFCVHARLINKSQSINAGERKKDSLFFALVTDERVALWAAKTEASRKISGKIDARAAIVTLNRLGYHATLWGAEVLDLFGKKRYSQLIAFVNILSWKNQEKAASAVIADYQICVGIAKKYGVTFSGYGGDVSQFLVVQQLQEFNDSLITKKTRQVNDSEGQKEEKPTLKVETQFSKVSTVVKPKRSADLPQLQNVSWQSSTSSRSSEKEVHDDGLEAGSSRNEINVSNVKERTMMNNELNKGSNSLMLHSKSKTVGGPTISQGKQKTEYTAEIGENTRYIEYELERQMKGFGPYPDGTDDSHSDDDSEDEDVRYREKKARGLKNQRRWKSREQKLRTKLRQDDRDQRERKEREKEEEEKENERVFNGTAFKEYAPKEESQLRVEVDSLSDQLDSFKIEKLERERARAGIEAIEREKHFKKELAYAEQKSLEREKMLTSQIADMKATMEAFLNASNEQKVATVQTKEKINTAVLPLKQEDLVQSPKVKPETIKAFLQSPSREGDSKSVVAPTVEDDAEEDIQVVIDKTLKDRFKDLTEEAAKAIVRSLAIGDGAKKIILVQDKEAISGYVSAIDGPLKIIISENEKGILYKFMGNQNA